METSQEHKTALTSQYWSIYMGNLVDSLENFPALAIEDFCPCMAVVVGVPAVCLKNWVNSSPSYYTASLQARNITRKNRNIDITNSSYCHHIHMTWLVFNSLRSLKILVWNEWKKWARNYCCRHFVPWRVVGPLANSQPLRLPLYVYFSYLRKNSKYLQVRLEALSKGCYSTTLTFTSLFPHSKTWNVCRTP